MLFETLGSYDSVNSDGVLSMLYKYCFSCIYPLKQPFTDFDLWRRRTNIVVNCKWQIGHLQNTLNYLFDPVLNRIEVAQSQYSGVFVPRIVDGVESTIFAPIITENEEPTVFLSNIYTDDVENILQIKVPVGIYNNDVLREQMIADINTIRFLGIQFELIPI